MKNTQDQIFTSKAILCPISENLGGNHICEYVKIKSEYTNLVFDFGNCENCKFKEEVKSIES